MTRALVPLPYRASVGDLSAREAVHTAWTRRHAVGMRARWTWSRLTEGLVGRAVASDRSMSPPRFRRASAPCARRPLRSAVVSSSPGYSVLIRSLDDPCRTCDGLAQLVIIDRRLGSPSPSQDPDLLSTHAGLVIKA